MERLPIPATKSNALKIKEELELAQDGKDLLEQKKDILISHINLLSSRAERTRKRLNAIFMEAYKYLKKAIIEVGRQNVEAASLSTKVDINVTIKEKSLMGVVLPLVSISFSKFRLEYGLYETSENMDKVRKIIIASFDLIAEIAEVEIGLKRLLDETQKTLKRINALSYIYIPLYKETLKAIEERLEEKEREALFQLKRLKGSFNN